MANEKKRSALGYLADETVKLNQKLGQTIIDTVASEGGPVSTLVNKGLTGLASGAYKTLKDSIADVRATGAPIGAAILGGREGLQALEAQDKTPAITTEGAAIQKSQAAAGTAGTTLGDASGTGAQSAMQTQDNALGMQIYDGAKTIQQIPEGYVMTQGNKLGSTGSLNISDWANQESKNSMHQAGMARLRAGLPYDAKEAAAAQEANAAFRERQSLANDQFVADYRANQERQNAIRTLEFAAFDNIGLGSNRDIRKNRAELLSQAEALRTGGTEDQTSYNRGFSAARQQLGVPQKTNPLSEKDIYDIAFKQNAADLDRARFGLEASKAGTEQAKFGLTLQEKKAEALGQQQNRMLDSQREINKVWADVTLDPRMKRRVAMQTRQQAGIPAIQSELMTLAEDQEAQAAIASGNYAALTEAYSPNAVKLFIQQMQQQTADYKLGK